MARKLTCGFEENNLTTTMWSTSVGTPTVVTTPVRSGTYALQINPSAGQEWLGRTFSAALTGTMFLRILLRVATLPDATAKILDFNDLGALQSFRLTLTTAGVLALVVDADSSTITGPTLSTDTWYRIEARIVISTTAGEAELRVDGTSQGTLTGKNTRAELSELALGNRDGSESFTFYYDDVAVNNATGTFQTSWPGNGKIFLLEPLAEGANIQFNPVPAGETNNAANVDDLPGAPDDVTTYNQNVNAAGQYDRLTMTDLGAEVPSDADIILLNVYGRVGSNGTSARTMLLSIWDEAGARTNGPSVNVAINGWKIITTDEHLVFDAGARTKANVDSFEVGYAVNTGTNRDKRITAEWVNVEWIEAPPAFAPDEDFYVPEPRPMESVVSVYA